jgi:hypothetical protein
MLVVRTNTNTGHAYEFDIYENSEFIKYYSHFHYQNWPHYAVKLCEKWNRQQPNNWRYELKEKHN